MIRGWVATPLELMLSIHEKGCLDGVDVGHGHPGLPADTGC